MGKVSTFFGDFEEVDEQEEGKVVPKEVDTEEKPDVDIEKDTEIEPVEKVEPEKVVPDSKGGGGKEVEEVDDLIKTFDSLVESLEKEELMFLDEDKVYEPTADGFQQMLKDNMEAQKAKLEKEFEEREAKLREELEGGQEVKFADLDPSDEEHALAMLEQYYQLTGFTEDEVKDKIIEVKTLDNLEKEAKIAQRFLVKEEQRLEDLEKKRKEAEIANKQKEIDDYITEVKSQIDAIDEVSGLKLDAKTKEKVKDYLFKVDKKDGLTQAQRASKDPQRRLKLAILDFMDFNKKDIEIKVKTELANEYSKKTSRFTSKNVSTKGTTVEAQESKEGLRPGFMDFWSTSRNED